MDPRPGYYTEQNRNAVYFELLQEKHKFDEDFKLIIAQLSANGPMTMQELGKALGKDASEMSARLNTLRDELKLVYNPTELKYDKKSGAMKKQLIKRLNPKTGKPNSLWALVETNKLEQPKLF